MENLTQTRRLQDTADHRRWVADRRNEAIARQATEVQADIARLQELYANGSLRKATPTVAPTYKEATTFTVKQLAGGAALSGRKRRPAAPAADLDAAAEAKRERRRQRRLARKQRQAAATTQIAK